MNITGTTRLAGVMGWPVTHSLSPRLQNYWLDRYGIDGAYVPLPVSPDHFAQALRVLSQTGFTGVNVTVPHKQAALAAVDEADETARRIGAVNTVVFREDGSLFGMNTDALGFANHLFSARPGFDPTDGPAVIVGAGGAARGTAIALMDAGVRDIRIVNRTRTRAEELARALGPEARVVNWVDRARSLDRAAILVNTTTQGMTGQPPLDLDLDHLPRSAVVYDIVYNPLATPLLKAAQARGNPSVDGLGMLLHQAVPGFAAWFGTTPDVTDALRAHVAAALA